MSIVDEVLKSKKLKEELRCVHRHTIDEHPVCFARGRIKWPDDKTFSKITGEAWYDYPGYRIAYADIEVDNLNADFGTVLCWCIKQKDGDIVSSIITKEELFNGTGDYRVIKEFIDEISKYKIVVGYYSSRFDIPFMRSKALYYDLDFPAYGDLFQWDMYFTVRDKLALSRNSLDNVCSYLGIEGKTPLDKDVWRKAKYGDKESIDLVLTHCEYDVIITEKLHNRLEFIRKWVKSSI
jgi:uncharacterized protein YprB with RNaseH-like and TPR domain